MYWILDFGHHQAVLLEVGVCQLVVCLPQLALLAMAVLLQIKTQGLCRGDSVQLLVALAGMAFYYLTPAILA